MKQMIGHLRRARETFWFVPTLMTSGAVILSFVTLEIDDRSDWNGFGNGPLGTVASADGARAVLATIAGSMITVASLSFSITIASLSLASTQLGPRLIRNFIRDTGNQVVLGTFIATFAYSLLVLRTVKGSDIVVFVPAISVTLAVVLAMASLAVLIYFINHISQSIQATRVIASIGRDLTRTIAHIYPDSRHSADNSPDANDDDWTPQGEPRPVYSDRTGYIRDIDHDYLVKAASKAGVVIHVPHHAGQFIAKGETLVEVFGAGAAPGSEEFSDQIQDAFQVAGDRVAGSDVEFYIDQLVEIAVRALSPGINDPFTAMACLDQLGASLRQLAERRLPPPNHRDKDGELRVHAKSQTFPGALSAAFNMIRQYGQTSPPVAMRLMETLAVLAEYAPSSPEKDALRQHARMVESSALAQMPEHTDIEALQERFQAVLDALESE